MAELGDEGRSWFGEASNAVGDCGFLVRADVRSPDPCGETTCISCSTLVNEMNGFHPNFRTVIEILRRIAEASETINVGVLTGMKCRLDM